jgi:4a-hydroxytetrahydrobiopterin dehydratase
MSEGISPSAFLKSAGVEDWRIVGSDGACAHFVTGSIADGARLAQAIGALGGVDEPFVRVDVRRDAVAVSLITMTKDYFGMSTRDVVLARQISAAAKRLCFRSDPSRVQSFLIIPGAPDTAAVMPFWQALLGYEPRPDSPKEDLMDPRRVGPDFWFEGMKEPRKDGGGAIHVCVWVPREEADARIAAALAAGGRMVYEASAPAWWTLADAAGNQADIATISARG